MKSLVSRRQLILSTTAGVLSSGIAGVVMATPALHASKKRPDHPIRAIQVGRPAVVPNNLGDTWVMAWANDDNLYTPSNDSIGFGIPSWFDRERARIFDTDQARFWKELSET